MGATGEERRRHPRWPVRGVLVVERQAREYPIYLLDLSQGGLRFEAQTRFAPETLIRILLDCYPVDVPLRALVSWCRPTSTGTLEHGAEFINLPESEQILLSDFLEESRNQT